MRFLAVALVVIGLVGCNGSRRKPAPTGYVPAANTIPFTTITTQRPSSAEGSFVGFVITDQAAYNAYFGGSAPSSPTVDFATETVLAVRGQVGNSNFTLTILGVDPTGNTGEAKVTYASQQTGSGTVAQVTVPAQHVIKFAKGPTTFTFNRL